jgi:2-polyprenyl-6-methoxyphenol hydroxylase-like FAD-dependent oxidoreductase
MTKRYDIAIIGAGAVGPVSARELSRYEINVGLLESNSERLNLESWRRGICFVLSKQGIGRRLHRHDQSLEEETIILVRCFNVWYSKLIIAEPDQLLPTELL